MTATYLLSSDIKKLFDGKWDAGVSIPGNYFLVINFRHPIDVQEIAVLGTDGQYLPSGANHQVRIYENYSLCNQSFDPSALIRVNKKITGIMISNGSSSAITIGEVYVKKGTINNQKILYDGTLTWANGSPANTQKTFDIKLESVRSIKILINNPSTETDLTVQVDDYRGTTAYQKDMFGVAKQTSISRVVEKVGGTSDASPSAGYCVKSSAKIVVSNDAALSSSGGFSAIVMVIQI